MDRKKISASENGEQSDNSGELPNNKKQLAKTALVQAVDYLARQSHSERKLRDKLKRKEYSDEEIDSAIQKVKDKNYLNNEETCARQFEILYKDSRSSVRQIMLKLQQRGFDSSLIKSLIPADTYERELKAAAKVLAIKYRPGTDVKKMLNTLYQKGFSYDVCKRAVSDFSANETEEL